MNDTTLHVFFAFHIAGGHIGLPLALSTMVVAKSVTRHPTLLNLLLLWILYSTANLLLLYSGQAYKPIPNFGLCLIQASVFYGSTAGAAAATLSVVFQLWLEFRCLLLSKSAPMKSFTLLLSPWICFTFIVTGLSVFSAKNPSLISNNTHFYCTISTDSRLSKAIVTAVSGFVLASMVLTLGFQASLLRTLFISSRQVRAINQSSYHLVLRVGIFSLYSLITFIIAWLLAVQSPASGERLFASTLPLAVFLIFGTQKENTDIWLRLFCKRKAEGHVPVVPSIPRQ